MGVSMINTAMSLLVFDISAAHVIGMDHDEYMKVYLTEVLEWSYFEK
jgi:hypothetical protein